MLVHLDDDGQLSMFAKGDEILIACDQGHHWIIRAQQEDTDSSVPPPTKAFLEDLPGTSRTILYKTAMGIEN